MQRVYLDHYILDTLMRDLVWHDKRPSAFLVYLHLWHLTRGRPKARAVVSLRAIAEETGLSKRAVQHALAVLVRRKLVKAERSTKTAVPEYSVLRPWRRKSLTRDE
jgi:DNA-binding GntR family transcriptional regulator